jgi:hypothetical protein
MAIEDLLYPSAFQTNPHNYLVGTTSPFSSAELISLKPERVLYSIAPGHHWSNGWSFTGKDLVAWWNYAKTQPSLDQLGYSSISDLKVSRNGLSVLASFSKPFSAWNELFRDVLERKSSMACNLGSLVSRPTLGPYTAVRVSASSVVLRASAAWRANPLRFGTIVFTTTTPSRSTMVGNFLGYSTNFSSSALSSLSSSPLLTAQVNESDAIVSLGFSSSLGIPSTQTLLREGLSRIINRTSLITKELSAVTFANTPATSALFSQGQVDYPSGTSKSVLTTTTTQSSAGSDCPSCAIAELAAAGYRQSSGRLLDAKGGQLAVSLGVGPTPYDKQSGAIVAATWRGAGAYVSEVRFPSDQGVAAALRAGRIQAGVYERPTTFSPFQAGRSWFGGSANDAFSSSFASSVTAAIAQQAMTQFNPVSALPSWQSLDTYVLNHYYVRPLFTPPALTVWSSSIGNFSQANTLLGLVDQVPNWLLTVPATDSQSS